MYRFIIDHLAPKYKKILRDAYYNRKIQFINTFLGTGSAELEQCIRRLGIQQGDTVLWHSSFSPFSGYRGSIGSVIDTFIHTVGPNGNLLMVSLPYRSSSYEYLLSMKCFDVNKTPSQMGLISETFRRQKNVYRSLHPTHPILARGPQAKWIVENHEHCLFPCGIDTPFDKLRRLNGKVAFFNVPFGVFTFFHYLEDLIKDFLPFPLYHVPPFSVPVMDQDGNMRTVTTYAFSQETIKRRHFARFEEELRSRKLIKFARTGNIRLLMVEVNSVVACTLEMVRQKRFFYLM